MSGILQNEYLKEQLAAEQNVASTNPLDRNLDGRVDANLNSGLNSNLNAGASQGVYVQSAKRSSVVRSEPTIIETIQKDVVVHERIHPVQKEEIQPVIYREREQLDVKQVTQMLHETQIHPTIVHQRELPAERREAIVERAAPIAENYIAPTTTTDATMRSQVVHAPIVNEVIRKTIIEEIQPVLERDIIQSTVIQNTQPIYEKYVDAPSVSRETRVVVERKMSGGSLEALAAQGFNVAAFTGSNAAHYNTGLAAAPLSTQLNSGVSRDANLYTENTAHASINRRKSLAEALPTSYGYLAQQEGLSAEAKIAQAEALNRQGTAAPLSSNVL